MQIAKGYKLIKCAICGSDDFSVVHEARYDAEKDGDLAVKFRSSGDEMLINQVVKCKSCGLQYINPVLNESAIIDGYSQGSDETFVSQNPGREKTFDICLDLVEKHIPGKGKALDIGTAGGAFLYVAKRRGWEVAGCEPNRWLCNWAKENYKIDITPGTIFDLKYPDATFNLVTLWDVLEHTVNPKKVLNEVNRMLKPGGVLVVNYPDIGSWIARLMGRRWLFLLSVHLYYFDPVTIRRILGDTGFGVERVKPHYQYLEFAYIFKRASAIIGPIGTLFQKIISAVGLGKLLIPYWLGQTLVIARKK